MGPERDFDEEITSGEGNRVLYIVLAFAGVIGGIGVCCWLMGTYGGR